jgi:hypothetical protein
MTQVGSRNRLTTIAHKKDIKQSKKPTLHFLIAATDEYKSQGGVFMQSLSKKTLHISGVALICLFVAAPGACTPKGEDMTPGLKGIDADANGIRDDIDALITKKYSDTLLIKRLPKTIPVQFKTSWKLKPTKRPMQQHKIQAI